MPLAVVKSGNTWLTIDTDRHRIVGRHQTRGKAVAQRRILTSLRKRGKAK